MGGGGEVGEGIIQVKGAYLDDLSSWEVIRTGHVGRGFMLKLWPKDDIEKDSKKEPE